MRGLVRVGMAAVLAILVVVGVAGCQSSGTKMQAQYELRKVTIETVPSGATVHVINALDGSRTLMGMTPCRDQTVAVLRSLEFRGVSPQRMQELTSMQDMVQVSIEKAGYQSYVGKLSTEPGGKVASHTITLEAKATTQAAN